MPLTSIDHVLIAVSDLDAATAAYEKLLGRRVSLRGDHPGYGTANAVFQFENIYVELIASSGPGPFGSVVADHIERFGEGLFGIAFGTEDASLLTIEWRKAGLDATEPMAGEGASPGGDVRSWRNVMLPPDAVQGLIMFGIEHISPPSTRPLAQPTGDPASALSGIDHVVVNTPDADEAIDLFGTKMGIRLALDRDAPQWGARMLFFRLGGVTLEVIKRLNEDEPATQASFGGMAFKAPDVHAAQARLAASGLDVSEVRKGRKPGTLVATVRDGTCGVPVLLIGPDPEAADNAA